MSPPLALLALVSVQTDNNDANLGSAVIQGIDVCP